MALCVALSVGTTAATGQPLNDRVTKLDDLVATADFDEAERLAEELLSSGSLTRAEVARAHLALGVVAAGRRDDDRALVAFARALRLEPELALSPAIGPEIAALFATARAATTPATDVPQVRLARVTPGVITVTLSMNDTARELAAGVKLEAAKDARLFTWSAGEPTEARWELGATACGRVTASVTDAFGNQLWPSAATLEPCPAPPPARSASAPRRSATPAEPPPAAQHTISLPVWCGVAVTAAFGVLTATAGVVSLKRRDAYLDARADTTLSLNQRWQLREDALNAQHATTTFGLLAVLAASTTLTIYAFTRPSSSVHVSAGLRPHGAALEGHF
jgi:hypothetical protein